MKEIALGKYNGLSQASTTLGTISILALDHRNNLRKALNPKNPSSVSDLELIKFKQSVVKNVSIYASAVLLDPEVGIAQCIQGNSLGGGISTICALEETGYSGDKNARISKLLPGWSVSKSKRIGCSGVKLLVYYNPRSKTSSGTEELISQVAEECNKNEVPFFLEPLSFSINNDKELSSLEKRVIVVETAQRLSPLGIDVLKAEFPLDVKSNLNEKQWAEACLELSQASVVPWILLSASVDYELFVRQVEIACCSGASGVAVGRAVWQEAVNLSSNEREIFLNETAAPRMAILTKICEKNAKSWYEFYQLPQMDASWLLDY
ncbi:MAG: tagatose 1,6-diphosphate aldolase [Clostridiaceae bacterium]|nr:tagatose 1,6-diphosphate aldolase [Clostridiaceae bacterium]